MSEEQDHSGSPLDTPEPQAHPWRLIALFVFAVCALAILIIVARFDPSPTQTNWYIYLTLLALAAGGFIALLPGAINFEVPGALKASGAVAGFALVFYFGANKAVPVTSFSMQAFLIFKESAPESPQESDVVVVVNSKVAKADLRSSSQSLPKVEDPDRSSTIDVTRDPAGGFRIDFHKLVPGDRVRADVYYKTDHWQSGDVVIPEGYWNMKKVSFDQPP